MAAVSFLELGYIIPELLLVLMAFAVVIVGVFSPEKPSRVVELSLQVGIIGMVAALIFLQIQSVSEQVLFNGMIKVDTFTHFARSLILVGALAVLLLSSTYLAQEGLERFEYVVLILLATAGMMWMVSAQDFLSLFMSLELQALAIYVLCAMNRTTFMVTEAATKYFILGALSTCLFLYGISLIYGYTSTTSFGVLHNVLQPLYPQDESSQIGLLVGLSFILASLCFKVSVVPFHMWTPDVYQGVPFSLASFLASVSKAAGVLLFVRILVYPLEGLRSSWQELLVFLVAGSMILGAIGALYQKDIKRLLAYSSIGQIGYTLLGLLSQSNEGLHAIFLNITLYMVTMIGLFGLLLLAAPMHKKITYSIEDLAGLGQREPLVASLISIFLLSLAGLPPLAGFFGKFYLFAAAIEAHYYALVIIGILTSVISAGYYLNVIKIIFFETLARSENPLRGWHSSLDRQGHRMILGGNRSLALLIYVTAIVVLLFFLYPSSLLHWTGKAVESFLP